MMSTSGAENTVEIEVSGEGNLMYQVAGSYYLPWDKLALYPELVPQEELVTIDVAYDRTELAVNDTVNVKVTVSLNQAGGTAESALIDLGLPPGFNVQAEDLAALVARYDDTPPDYEFAEDRALRADRAADPGVCEQPEQRQADRVQLWLEGQVPAARADPCQHGLRLLQPRGAGRACPADAGGESVRIT